jgi:hypothetical protein
MLPEQEGAYFRLLCYQWNSENQTIPDNDADLSMLSRLGGRWETLGSKVKACFDPVPDVPGVLRNERLWHEYNRILGLRSRQAEGGRKAMSNRWTKTVVSDKSPITDLDSHLQQGTENREQRTENGKGKSLSSYRTWTEAEFRADVEALNGDQILTPEEVDDFVAYWQEKSPTGRTKLQMERTWETRRRMKTAVRMIYQRQRLFTPATSDSIRETDPGILDYARQAKAVIEFQEGRNIGDLYRKVRNNYGPTGVDRVKRAMTQLQDTPR